MEIMPNPVQVIPRMQNKRASEAFNKRPIQTVTLKMTYTRAIKFNPNVIDGLVICKTSMIFC
jgi:hypothetical protein